jgi:hypothetical protein
MGHMVTRTWRTRVEAGASFTASQHAWADSAAAGCCNTSDRSTTVNISLVRLDVVFAIAFAGVSDRHSRCGLGGLLNSQAEPRGASRYPQAPSVSLRLVRFPITPSFSSPRSASGALPRPEILPTSALDLRSTPCLISIAPHPSCPCTAVNHLAIDNPCHRRCILPPISQHSRRCILQALQTLSPASSTFVPWWLSLRSSGAVSQAPSSPQHRAPEPRLARPAVKRQTAVT